MRTGRRHPSRKELGAWFDGEAGDVGAHVLGCQRCGGWVEELAHLRSTLIPLSVAVSLAKERPADRA